MFDCLNTPDLRWKSWLVVVLVLLLVVVAVTRSTSSPIELLIGLTLVTLTIGLAVGFARYLGEAEAVSFS